VKHIHYDGGDFLNRPIPLRYRLLRWLRAKWAWLMQRMGRAE